MTVEFTVRTGLFRLKSTHRILAVGVRPTVPGWNDWLESSTEYRKTEFSLALGVITDFSNTPRSQVDIIHFPGTGCTRCRCTYRESKENEWVGELHCYVS